MTNGERKNCFFFRSSFDVHPLSLCFSFCLSPADRNVTPLASRWRCETFGYREVGAARTRKSPRWTEEGRTRRQGRSLTRNVAGSAPIFREEPVPVGPWNFYTAKPCASNGGSGGGGGDGYEKPTTNTCLLLIYRRPIRFSSINVTGCNCVLVADR